MSRLLAGLRHRAPAFRIPLARAKRKCHGYCTRAGFDPDPTLTVGVPWVSCWRAIAGETLSTFARLILMLGTQSFRESRAYRRKKTSLADLHRQASPSVGRVFLQGGG